MVVFCFRMEGPIYCLMESLSLLLPFWSEIITLSEVNFCAYVHAINSVVMSSTEN